MWLANFFKENLSEVIGAYFDGEKIFIVRLTGKFETIEVDADAAEIEHLAKKIAEVCNQKGWETSAVGFCLRADDAVTFQTEVGNVPEKEIPALVKSWAMAQAGADSVFSFAKVGEELWMETIPQKMAEEYSAAFKKFDLNLRALSVMPDNVLDKIHPFDRTEFISEIVRDKKSPNLLATRGGSWNLKKISAAIAAVFIGVILIGSVKIFLDSREISAQRDAAKISVENLREEIILQENLSSAVAELRRLNNLAAQVSAPPNLNRLINLGKISDRDIHLKKIRAEEKFLELEGSTDNPDAVKNYLSRVKNSVSHSARLESSAENSDGKIIFVIRATFD